MNQIGIKRWELLTSVVTMLAFLSGGVFGDQHPPVEKILGITAGEHFTCGWFNDGSAGCWGANSFGQLGTGTIDDEVAAKKTLNIKDLKGVA